MPSVSINNSEKLASLYMSPHIELFLKTKRKLDRRKSNTLV